MYAYKRIAERIAHHITNQNTSERNKNFFRLLEILLFLTFSAIYSVFLFFRALKKNMVFFQSNDKFSLTYSHSLCLSIPSIDQLTLNGGPLRKSRDSVHWYESEMRKFSGVTKPSFLFCHSCFSKSNLSSIYLPYFHTL